jgi:hypothetical protein
MAFCRTGDEPPAMPVLLWDWVRVLIAVEDEQVLRWCGADTLMFLRFMRLGFKVRMHTE